MKTTPVTDERELLVKLRDGDQRAFQDLYHLYSKRILINTIRMVKDEDEAQEILQDVFIRLWNSRKNIDPDKPFRSYLLSINQNLVRDFFRREALDRKMQATLITQSTELYDHIESDLYFKESSALLQRAIDALPLQRRRIYTLCKIEGKSYNEVAEIMGITVPTVGNQLVKATQSIKAYFHAAKTYIAILVTLLLETF